ncbi:MAG TPA: response regulator [Patescibacteria group bacterium]|jgi:anti-anti-sigma factor|nr:response regulator [Patescibacteria group bacterium]
MKIGASAIDGILIVTLGEEQIVASNVEQIKAELTRIIPAGSRKIVLDLGPVRFLDSSGVGLMVAMMKSLNREGGTLRVAGLASQPLALFRTVNLDRVIPISRDIEEALTILRDARGDDRMSLEPGADLTTSEVSSNVEQILSHTRLSYEAMFGAVPERLGVGLRWLFEKELLRRPGLDQVGESMLDEQLQWQKRQILGEMAQGMASRFRNILVLVIGRIQFLRMVTADEKVRGSLDIMENAALQGMAAVKRVDEFQSGAATRVVERLPLRGLLDDAVELVRMKRENDSNRAGGTLRIIREFVGSPVVTGCHAELKQAFVDVLLNAVEAMPNGGVLTVSANQSKDVVAVTIADTGKGMSPEKLEQAFEPLFSTKLVQGAGIGLPIARAVMEKHNGSIFLESQLKRGTTAVISLPAAPAEAAAPAEPATPQMPAEREIAPPEVAHRRVLVVDDEPMVCDLLKDILSAMGCEVTLCASGREALNLFPEGRYDLVMTDLNMPGMSGWEVAREIHSRDSLVPVALFSAWGAQLDTATIKDNGIDFVFPKPFEISTIRDVLGAAMELCDRRHSEAAVDTTSASG